MLKQKFLSDGEESLSDSRADIPITTSDDGNPRPPRLPLILYVKQSYSLPGYGVRTPCVSSESLNTIIDMEHGVQARNQEERMLGPPLKPLNACPVSHEILMLLSLKQSLIRSKNDDQTLDEEENGQSMRRFQFDVKLVNPNKMLPEELRRKMIHHLPVLVDYNHGRWLHGYSMDLVEYLQGVYPTKQLDLPKGGDQKKERLQWKLFNVIHLISRRFYNFVQQYYQQPTTTTSSTARQLLIDSLGSLNVILSFSKTRYLVQDNYPTILDCHLMPRLHHIRVLLEYLDHCSIPDGYWCIWHYLSTAYNLEEFIRWCPSDQEILLHWMLKIGGGHQLRYDLKTSTRLTTPPSSSSSYRNRIMELIRSTPKYSFGSPSYENQVTKL